MSAPTPFGLRPVFDPIQDPNRPEVYARRRVILQTDPRMYNVGDRVEDLITGTGTRPVPAVALSSYVDENTRRGAAGVIVSIEEVTRIPAAKTEDYHCWVLEMGTRRFWCFADWAYDATIVGRGGYLDMPLEANRAESDLSPGVLRAANDEFHIVALASNIEFPGNSYGAPAVWEVRQLYPNSNRERFL